MRIIAGTARGIQLAAPPDRQIRPTLDRVRESLFNILAPRMEGCRFLDLYAGTGANGLEALSRGAAEVVFVEENESAQRLIRENLRRTRLEGPVRLLPYRLPDQLSRVGGMFDVIFADPPYATHLEPLLEAVAAAALLTESGVFVLEHDAKQRPETRGGLSMFREKRYGTTLLSFYEQAENGA